ncbi:trehalose-phosphatase [Tropicibacter oceani]|uniref:Trehalose 6-phosphate phosphatase n=1 Tax=Tropicibacter oceani TaxID=3058420 RepID=A0ABY8QP31_9RHOB|nr:trehalose-phosphatase [Tropicibacter oceani]WGW05811.1 trehalose-phosphatase [Tropicibacter oceani]
MISEKALVTSLPPVGGAAVLLDFDGTLVDLAPTPEAITVPADLPDLLRALGDATQGALALVSGRSIAALERFVPGFDGVILGGHGAERRDGQGLWRHPLAGSDTLARLIAGARRLADTHPALNCEEKPTGVVLHYRRAPEQETRIRHEMTALAAPFDGLDVHFAKMAVELRPDDIGKDRATRDLLNKAPFAGRSAVFCGDDATDEPAMRLCVETGGTACKVGEGPSAAPLRVADPQTLRAALWAWTQNR